MKSGWMLARVCGLLGVLTSAAAGGILDGYKATIINTSGNAVALNDYGAVLLESGDTITVWQDGVPPIQLSGFGKPIDINNNGQILTWDEASGLSHVVDPYSASIQYSVDFQATDMNDWGDVVGSAHRPELAGLRGFVYNAGAGTTTEIWTKREYPWGDIFLFDMHPTSINNLGTVGGWALNQEWQVDFLIKPTPEGLYENVVDASYSPNFKYSVAVNDWDHSIGSGLTFPFEWNGVAAANWTSLDIPNKYDGTWYSPWRDSYVFDSGNISLSLNNNDIALVEVHAYLAQPDSGGFPEPGTGWIINGVMLFDGYRSELLRDLVSDEVKALVNVDKAKRLNNLNWILGGEEGGPWWLLTPGDDPLPPVMVPEPSSLALAMAGIPAALGWWRVRRRRVMGGK